MAINVEAVTIGSAVGTNQATAGPIVPAGSNRLVIGMAAHSAGSLANYSDMTFGGNQMTAKLNVTNTPYIRGVAEELLAPATSSQSLVYTAAASQDELICAVVALSGVDQTTPTDTYQSSTADTGDPVSVSLSPPSGDLGIGFAYTISATIASGNTQLTEVEGVNGGVCGNMASSVNPATTMTWTRTSAGLNDSVAMAVNVNAAAAAAATSLPLPNSSRMRALVNF